MTLALSRGNRDVFAAVAPAVCDFVDAYAGGARSGPTIDEFVAELPSTLAPDAATELPPFLEYGHAYRYYHEALEASSDKVRSKAILAGNIVLAYNEQLRLQPVIEAAFTALPQRLRMLLRTNRCFVACLPFVRVVGQFWLDAIEYRLDPLRDGAPRLAHDRGRRGGAARFRRPATARRAARGLSPVPRGAALARPSAARGALAPLQPRA